MRELKKVPAQPHVASSLFAFFSSLQPSRLLATLNLYPQQIFFSGNTYTSHRGKSPCALNTFSLETQMSIGLNHGPAVIKNHITSCF